MKIMKKEKPLKIVMWMSYISFVADITKEMYDRANDKKPMTVPEIIHYITNPRHHAIVMPKILGKPSPEPQAISMVSKISKSHITNNLDAFLKVTLGLTEISDDVEWNMLMLGDFIEICENYHLTSSERRFIHAELVDPYLKTLHIIKREFIPLITDQTEKEKIMSLLQSDQTAIEIFSDAVLNNVPREEFLASFGIDEQIANKWITQ